MGQMTDFQKFIKTNKLKQKQVAAYLETSPQYISQVAKGLCSLSDEKYEKLVQGDWDISMLNIPPYIKVPSTLTVFNPTPEECQDAGAEVDISMYPAEVVEEIEEKVRAEMMEAQPKFVPIDVARKPNLDAMEWLKKGGGSNISSTFNMMAILQDTHFYTELRSNAMSPALTQGEILFLKEFEKGYQFIDGQPYAIDTKSRGMLVFYLYDRGDYVECRPHNIEFGTLNIPKEDISRYYKILFHGSTWIETSLPRGGCQQQVAKQSEQISTLIGELGKAGDRVDRMGEQVSRVLDLMEQKLR